MILEKLILSSNVFQKMMKYVFLKSMKIVMVLFSLMLLPVEVPTIPSMLMKKIPNIYIENSLIVLYIYI